MEETRRARAVRAAREEMIAVRGRILYAVADRTEAELLAAPPSGGWSAAELLDHLWTSESKIVKGLTRVADGKKVRLPRRVWFYRLPMSVAFVPIKLKAPEPVRPKKREEIASAAEVIERLATSRRDFLAIAERLGEERFSRLLFPHFILGRFDGLDWFRFVSRHETRHLAQLKRILGIT